MDSNRQKKIGQLLQKELAEIFRKQSAESGKGFLISVTEVRVSPDLSVAKTYLSIYPKEYRDQIFKEIESINPQIRKILGNNLGKHLRQIPFLAFYLDTTLDRAEEIDRALKGKDKNPLV